MKEKKNHRFLKAIVACTIMAVGVQVGRDVISAAGLPTSVSVVNPQTVVAGTAIEFQVTVNNPTYGSVTNGSQRIQWANPLTKKTYDVANRTVVSLVSVIDGVYTFKYVPSASEIGRNEVFSVTVPVSNARIPKTVTGWGYFSVLDPNPEPVEQLQSSLRQEFYPPSCYSSYIYSYATGFPVAVGASAGCSQVGMRTGYQNIRVYVACNGGGWILGPWKFWSPGVTSVKYCPSGTATAKSYQIG